MDKEKIAPHVDDIVKALENKVERKTIENELENYVDTYRVDLDIAKRSIVKKYGGKISALNIGTNRTLAELRANEQSVEIICKLLTVNPKEIEVEGAKKQIYYGLVTDGTETLPYTAWEISDFTYGKGDVIRALNAYTSAKEWNGKPQINFGTRSTIYKEDKEKFPDFVSSSADRGPVKKITVNNLQIGIRNIAVTARVLSVEKRDIMINDVPRTVFSGVIGDTTGQVQFSAWDDFKLAEDDCISVLGGYVSSWRGLPQLNFDSNSAVEKIKDNKFPKRSDILNTLPIAISEVLRKNGALASAIRGIVVDVKQGSGLVFRCPECKRVTNKSDCKIHGRVDAVPDLRTKAVLDDNTGTVTVILNRELTEQVLGKNLEACINEARDKMNPDIIQEDLARILVARPFQARGNISRDDFGLTMLAATIEPSTVDVKDEARKILDELTGE